MDNDDEKLAERQFRTMLMAYPRLVEDLHDWQRRQWHVVYYALLLLGAVSAMTSMIADLVKPMSNTAGISVTIIAAIFASLVILILSCRFINMLEDSAVNTRRDIKSYRNNEEYRQYFLPLKELGCNYASPSYDSESLFILRTVLTAASVLTVLFVFIYSIN